MTAHRKVWTEQEVRALGVRVDGVTACAIVFGVGRDVAYRLLRTGDVPFRVLRAGRTQYVVPTRDVLAALGLDDDVPRTEPAHLVSDGRHVAAGQRTTDIEELTRGRVRR